MKIYYRTATSHWYQADFDLEGLMDWVGEREEPLVCEVMRARTRASLLAGELVKVGGLEWKLVRPGS